MNLVIKEMNEIAFIVDPAKESILLEERMKIDLEKNESFPNLNHLFMRLSRKHILDDMTGKKIDINQNKRQRQYLFTGMDLFTFNEPCIMCSMALLHSRIGRVFFVNPNKDNIGGLVSNMKLGVHSKLNHTFQSFMCSFV